MMVELSHMTLTFLTFHSSLMVLSAILLFLSLAFRARNLHTIVLTLVVFEIFRYLIFNPDGRLHISIDLVILGAIGVFCMLSRYLSAKFLILLAGVGSLMIWHMELSSKTDLSSDMMEIDEDMELFVLFEEKEHLKAWVKDNEEAYDITYPLFTPADEEFLLDEFIGINLASNSDINAVKKELLSAEHVLSVELNELVDISQELGIGVEKTILNDAKLDEQWISDSYDLAGYHDMLRKQTQALANGTSVIAILDTGVDADHEDLKENYKSTSLRYDKDVKGHGTHCAGVAAAVTGNALGIASLLPPASPIKVTGIKVLTDLGIGNQKMIIDGIIKAADEGYAVISMSLGGRTNDRREAAYSEVVAYAKSKGSIVISAAGNASRDANQHSPANTPGMIAVTAVDQNKKLASFANSVASLEMGIAAPGVEILSTMPDDSYESHNGTSMAAPFISGLVGLLKYYQPDLTAEEAYALMRNNADVIDGVPVINPTKTIRAFLSTQDPISEE